MMLCAVAGIVGYQSSAWGQGSPALAQLQYPFYLNPVAIGSNGGIDLASSSTGPSFGGLVVLSTTAGATGGTSGFGYLNPNTGLPEYGVQGVRDAIIAGGNSVSHGTATFQGISGTNTQQVNNAVVGYFDNNANGTNFYNSWRGIDLTAAGPTSGQPTVLVSPTYIGDATLAGNVSISDYSDWLSGYLTQAKFGWQNGDYQYAGSVQIGSYSDWLANYLATAGSEYPGFGTTGSPVLPAAGPVSAVPEPATLTLLIVPALAVVFFGYRRRKTS
jgi:hypothetical protein